MVRPIRIVAAIATALVALGFMAGSSDSLAQQRATGFSSVSVDVSPLRERGLGPLADVLQGTLQEALREEFGARLGPGGPRLVVRLDSLLLPSYLGDSADEFGSGMSTDFLDGAAVLVGPNGQVLATYPQLLTASSSSGGAWYAPDNQARRAAHLARAYAQWLGRRI